MPPIPKPRQTEPSDFAALMRDFFREADWSRNCRGNLTRRWGEELLTVYCRRGRFGWCRSSDDDGPQFSERMFDTEQGALDDVWESIGF